MSLHLAISTTCTHLNSPALLHFAAHLGSWRLALMLVEICLWSIYTQIEQGTTPIGKPFNHDAGNSLAVDSESNRHSGRYRQKQTVPI